MLMARNRHVVALHRALRQRPISSNDPAFADNSQSDSAAAQVHQAKQSPPPQAGEWSSQAAQLASSVDSLQTLQHPNLKSKVLKKTISRSHQPMRALLHLLPNPPNNLPIHLIISAEVITIATFLWNLIPLNNPLALRRPKHEEDLAVFHQLQA